MNGASWRGAVVGATTTLLLQLPIDATYGLIAFAALGAAYAPMAAASAMLSVVVAHVVLAAAGSRYFVVGPRAGSALIIAALVLALQTQPAVALLGGLASAQGAALVVALAAVAVVLSGLMQLGLGALGLGNLARFLPFPVRAGFLTGVGVLLIVSGGVMVLGGSTVGSGSKWQALGHALAHPAWAAVLIGLVTCGITALPPNSLQLRPNLRVPPPLLGFAVGMLLHFVLQALFVGINTGQVLGAIGPVWQPPALVWAGLQQLDWAVLASVLPLLLGSSFALAVLAAVEMSLAGAVVDTRLRYSRDGNRETLAQGLSNIVCGVVGAQPSSPVVGRSMVLIESGGTWAGAALVFAALVAAVTLAWPDVLRWVPLSAVGGGLMGVGLLMLDRWTLQNLASLVLPSRRAAMGPSERRALYESLALTLLVVATIVGVGLVWGVLVGVAAAMVMLVRSNTRQLVRSVQKGDTRRSKKVRLPRASAALADRGQRVVLIELQGMLFFGTAAELTEQVRRHSLTAECVVLSLQRVTDIDATGARALLDLAKELTAQNKVLMAADLLPGDTRLHHLKALGWPADDAARMALWADPDQALQWSEDWVLRDFTQTITPQAPMTLGDTVLGANLSVDELQHLRAQMTQHHFEAGHVLFNVGEDGDALYVSLSGDIAIGLPGSARRLATFAPGVVVGELALMDTATRSAQAVAETPLTVLRLDRRAFEKLRQDRPALWDGVMRNLTLHLAVRLRSVTHELTAALAR
jgi:sulfate permease, SulP family